MIHPLSRLSVALLAYVSCASAAVPLRRQNETTVAADRACNKLATAFPKSLYTGNATEFENQSLAIWSQTCLLTPTCVFLPSSAAEIGEAVTIIQETGSKFSVRAGGHMPVPGAQSVEPGVFISLSNLNERTLNENAGTISIGPGQTWGEVYDWLVPYGLAVNGGRYPSVGVGGVLIGGGIGYFSSTQGWGCDNVVAFEAVLADGTVVEATEDGEYADLFWALRGGHNNFAIVTRFDVKYFEVTSAFAKMIAWRVTEPKTSDQFFAALEAYMAPGGGVDDPNVAIIPSIAASPSLGFHEVITAQFAPGNDSSPAAFANFTTIEGQVEFELGGEVYESWTAMPNFLNTTGARNLRQIFWGVSFKTDARAMSIANRTVMDMTSENLGDVADVAVALTYQPISAAWLRESEKRGGNALGLDPELGTFIGELSLTLKFNRQSLIRSILANISYN